jgi:ATP-binding cassette subfamily B protein RaxB
MVASYHGHRIDLTTLRRRYPVSLKGVTLRAVIHVASQLHLASRAIRFELEHLRSLRLPAIVHWDMNHLVVLKCVTRRGITVHDPAGGQRFFSLAEPPSTLPAWPSSFRHQMIFFPRTREPGSLSLHSGAN